jgi:E3 ubiquitin-protein ligase UBR4
MEINEKPIKDIDPEFFHHIVTCIKNIATVRPQHISQFEFLEFGDHGTMNPSRVIETLCKVFEKLVQVKPKNIFIVPVDRPGIQRIETVAMGLAEIIYSVMAADVSLVPKLSPCLIRLLLSRNNQICVPVRTVLVKRLRPKNVRKRKVTIPGPSPPRCATPDATQDSPRESISNVNNAAPIEQDAPQLPLVEVDEPIMMLDDGQDNDEQMQMLNPLDAFMGAEGFELPPGMDLHAEDAEDEAMVELAIALSLQEQAGGAALAIQGIQEGLQALEDMHQEVLNAEAISPPEDEQDQDNPSHDVGAESDATASQNSDDEGSTVATEGSTMRNSEPVSFIIISYYIITNQNYLLFNLLGRIWELWKFKC